MAISFQADGLTKSTPGVNDLISSKNSPRKPGSDKPRRSAFVEIHCNILEAVPLPLMLLDYELKVIKANHSFYSVFNAKPEETEGKTFLELDNQQWDVPQLRKILEYIPGKNTVLDGFELEREFDLIGRRKVRVNASRILYQTKITDQLILLSLEDLTDRDRHKLDLEELVKKRTIELNVAHEDSESKRLTAEAALSEIQSLKDQLEMERAYLLDEIKLEYNHHKIIGRSDGLKHVLYKVEQIASSDTTVLILGETGTGKELVARAIHDLSLRKNRTLVKVNCATLPPNLIESELFGHEKGAFTGSHARHLGRFEVANDSSFFLDEIGELPLDLQGKLLRVLQDGEFERLGSTHTIKVNTRIIAATNRNLLEEVRMGRFREDLWYRLNIFPITIPPLRERPDDIPLLVKFYVNKISKRLGKTIDTIPVTVMNNLQQHRWPGNIRELENVLERAVINSPESKLRLVDELEKAARPSSTPPKTLAAMERDYILQVLKQTKWKISGKDSAAEILGLDRSTLRARMKKLHIQKP